MTTAPTVPPATPAHVHPKKRGPNWSQIALQLPAYIILGAWSLFVIFVLGWILAASLSSTREIFTNTLLQSGFHWENYVKALQENSMGRYLINTMIFVTISCLLLVAISAPAAYVLSRMEFPGKALVRQMILSALGIPGLMLLIPLFMLFTRLHLTDSPVGLIIVYVGTTVPFTVFFLTSFFAALPHELEEAAAIDGASAQQTFWRIMLPLARPGLATVTIFNFIHLFNEYFWALVFVNTPENRTLSIGLEGMIQSMRYSGDYAALFAGINVVVIPTVLFFIWQSRNIIGGVTAGAVK